MNEEEKIETLYVWLLYDEQITMTFIGYDHVRRTSKAYTSTDHEKIETLANKIAQQKGLLISIN